MTDEEESSRVTLRDALGALARRRKAAIITTVVGALITLALALLLPPYFKSTATILIEQQEVPQDLVRSTVSAYADERVQVISQRVMTTQNLLDIIRRYDLYPRERNRDTREELMERMRKDIDFRMISADVIDPRSGNPRQATIAFTVSYRSRSPDQAVKVANELTTLYLNENVTERTRLAKDATSFLLEEGDRLSKEVDDLEHKLAKFKSEHLDALPDLQSLNMTLLDRTEQELRDTDMRRMSLEQQRVFLEGQLAQLKPNSMLMSDSGERIMSVTDRLKMLKSKLASDRALYAPDYPDIERLEREIRGLEGDVGPTAGTNEIQRDLERARGELAEAQKRYSPDHPDVQRLTRRVASLEAALKDPSSVNGSPVASVASAPVAAASAVVSPAQSSSITPAQSSSITQELAKKGDLPDNPAYIEMQAQLEAAKNDERALDIEQAKLRAQIDDYHKDITTSPKIEQEYRDLARDYEDAQAKYNEVRSKQMEARLAQNLESDRKGERFTLIEPPLPPEEPVSPNRPAILILGLLLSIALTAGIVALLETLDATVRGRHDLSAVFASPPLALIPNIVTELDMRAHRRTARLATATAGAAVLLTVVGVHLFVRPLDVLWFIALRRLDLF
jgi:polysaccharide biosynthesis transport protein